MRIVIISDIHSNLVALEAVLAAAGSYDALWCLGDTIGYGPRPNECVALMRQHAAVTICGNHDLACLDKIDLRDFNPDARKANIWNGEQLSAENRAWLETLPDQALANFELFNQQVCFIGHSHVQLGFSLHVGFDRVERFLPESGHTLRLAANTRYLINPGSVGQPRDQDPRAAYAVLDTDTETIRFNRVEYAVEKTQRQMVEAGLPPALIRRLEFGM